MDIKIHENDQLLSIGGIEIDFESKVYFLRLLYKLFQHAGNVLVELKRINYEDSSIDRLIKEGRSLGIMRLKIDPASFEISFAFNVSKSNDELLPLIVDLWYCFEQPSFCFFTNEEGLDLNYEFVLNNNLSWKEIVNLSNSYVMFKGAEEDVIWVGKSDELDFDLE